MELWNVSTSDLDGWVAATLQPSTDFSAAVKKTVQQICDFLKEECFEDKTRVFKTVKVRAATPIPLQDPVLPGLGLSARSPFSPRRVARRARARLCATTRTPTW